MHKYIVTITPPTPNGDLHLGHLSGPFLAADILARLLKQKKNDVLLLSYSDDYQSYLFKKAKEVSVDPFELASSNAVAMENSLKSINIQLDHFLKSQNNKYFLNAVNEQFKLVEDAGQLKFDNVLISFCDKCNVYGYEGFASGVCNHCGSKSDASQCEVCAEATNIEEMDDMKCSLCNNIMIKIEKTLINWTIHVNFKKLKESYKNSHHRPALKQFLKTNLARIKSKWIISRPGEKAIPLEKYPDHPVHTWFSGLSGYKATLKEYLDLNDKILEFDQWWSEETILIHFLGFDCSYSHVIAYPSQLILESGSPKKWYHFTNKFLRLNGVDFSTSRNHAVWIRDLSKNYPVDAIRLYTALYSPENEVKNFDISHFKNWVDTFYYELESGSWVDSESYSPNSTDLSQDSLHNFIDIYKLWKDATSLEKFSISDIASSLLRTLDWIKSLPKNEILSGWLMYSALSKSVQPELSEKIEMQIKDTYFNLLSFTNDRLIEKIECHV